MKTEPPANQSEPAEASSLPPSSDTCSPSLYLFVPLYSLQPCTPVLPYPSLLLQSIHILLATYSSSHSPLFLYLFLPSSSFTLTICPSLIIYPFFLTSLSFPPFICLFLSSSSPDLVLLSPFIYLSKLTFHFHSPIRLPVPFHVLNTSSPSPAIGLSNLLPLVYTRHLIPPSFLPPFLSFFHPLITALTTLSATCSHHVLFFHSCVLV